MFIGDLHGLNTLEHQPAKVAAMEGIWETQRGAALTLFGFPDEQQRTTRAAIKVPKLGSLILTHEWNGEIKGLNDFIGEHPPVAPVFWSFRVMVGVGFLMLLVSWVCAFQLWRKDSINRISLRMLFIMTFSGWVAVLAGWYVTEIGRQPWIVSGLISTAEVVADHPSGTLLITLIAYFLMYAFLLVSYIGAVFYMSSKPARSLLHMHNYGLPGTHPEDRAYKPLIGK